MLNGYRHPYAPAHKKMLGIFRVSWGMPAVYSEDYAEHTDPNFKDEHGSNYVTGAQWRQDHPGKAL